MESFTKQALSKILNIPASTVSYYIGRHEYFMTYQGTGRKKRYLRQTLEALKVVTELIKNNKDKETIDNELSSLFSKEIEVQNTTTAITTMEQQQKLIEALTTNLKEISGQKIEIQALREEIRELRGIITIPLFKRIFKKRIKAKIK
jgi:predicted transcriptional regulator